MKRFENTEKQLKKFDIQVNAKADDSVLNDVLSAYKKHQESKEHKQAPNIGRIIMKNPITKLAAAAVVIIVALFALNQFGSSSIAWADVVEKFGSIPFFNATLYMKDSSTEEPVQIEVWRNSQRKTRIRVDGQVLFADGANVIAGFAIDSPIRKLDIEEYNEMGMSLAQNLFSIKEFSLDSIIKAFGSDKDQIEETTPLINSAAMISKDLLVFDIQPAYSSQWVRIWVLRESRLPIQIRGWNPRDGECVDAFINYSNEQSPEFFDPQAYEQILTKVQQGSEAGGKTNLAYALLTDPGGREYTPKDLFEKEKAENTAQNPDDVSGYHMPKIEQLGITEYGAVWIIASDSLNQRPDGRPFWGYADISDNIKTKYHSTYGRYRSTNSIQVWVPDDYPFQTERPTQITARCAVEAHSPYEKQTLIGNEIITDWQQNTLWPKDKLNLTEAQMILRYAWNKTDDRPMCEKMLQLAQKLDTDDQCSHEIKKIKLRMLLDEKNYQDAVALANKLLPIEIEIFKNKKANADYSDFYDYIIATAGTGDIQAAKELFNEIKLLKADLSSYSEVVRKEVTDRLVQQLDGRNMYLLIRSLFNAGLDLEQANTIVGFDLLQNEDTKWYVPEKFRRQQDPRFIKQQAYLRNLTQRYKDNPLKPGQIVFNECKLKDIGYAGPIPELENYYFYVFNKNLHDFLKDYKSSGNIGRVNRIRIDSDIENPLLQHEIIHYSPERKFDSDLYREVVMEHFGLEAVEGISTETVLIAEYDDSPLKDYRDVRCPAIRGSTSTPGMMKYRNASGINIIDALNALALDQEIMVINNTGLDDKTIITQEVANFKTEKGMELAEQWYKENFGITFRKEQRQLPVWTIRKKQ